MKQLVLGEQRRVRAVAEISDDLLSRGPKNAAVTLELFADLQSPVSRPTIDVLDQLMKKYPTVVRLQFRNYPLAFHAQAALAHEAAMTAARQGQFWPFASFILGHQDSLREQDLIIYAGRLGLDEAAFAEYVEAELKAQRVNQPTTP